MDIRIEHTELSEKVYRLLKDMILSRKFTGGQKLDLNELSAQMNISRTPLKDAVNRLVAEGLMEVKPRSGTFVTAITADDIEQVMEIRKMIELWCVSRLTPDARCALTAKLEEIAGASRREIDSEHFRYEAFLQYDVEFHKAIVVTVANKRMADMYASLNSFLQVSRIYFFQHYERSVNGQQEHEAIARHIAGGELDKATELLEAHLDNSKRHMIQLVEDNSGII